MILRKLLRGIDYQNTSGPIDVDISAVAYDSTQVTDGGLFVAIKGENTDGHRFVVPALRSGAGAVVIEEPVETLPEELRDNTTVIRVADTKTALAKISSNFYGDPTSLLTLVGVTGTNGKTTVTYLLDSIWKEEGRNPGLLGTIETRFGDRSFPSPLTTPEATDLMKTFSEMIAGDTDCAVMEVSSHSLSRKRVDGCSFDACVFTNLSQDHLDYHGSMENYFKEKKRLFTELLPSSGKGDKYSIINTDDRFGERLAAESKGTMLSYSLSGSGADVFCLNTEADSTGITSTIATPWGKAVIKSELYGSHNMLNILAASTCALALGASLKSVEAGVNKVKKIHGRLERIETGRGFDVLIDYAHTPDALLNALKAVKPLTKGSVVLVFGCGGDRDPLKRPLMGRIGRELSDVLIITSDNPRTEDPQAIIDQIKSGFKGASNNEKPYYIISDRRDAITRAIELSKQGDTVLIAGKGHENYQILGTTRLPLDDREVAGTALEQLKNK
ncbi:MAG: UDP-N-acetylmuramoyl-L-alanyl-D-glutamate--2,6-diaminopimelate ligase [Candidatus Dadabacteria bacterium]|nr:UDP-N-acetylmuramoyl-L-alanyl-D-glutamate--2,6-diaminopimelate ligase [Candidatus Dadabacteria bacterium]